MGLIGGVLAPLFLGTVATLMSPVAFVQRPLRWLQAISRYRATVSGGPNFAYDHCLRRITPEQRDALDLRSWQVAFCGAEPINARTLRSFAAHFAPCGFRAESLKSCYGLAESTLMVSAAPSGPLPVIRHLRQDHLARHVVTPCQDSSGTPIPSCGYPMERR